MTRIIRFPVPLAPGRSARLARQAGLSPEDFKDLVRIRSRELVDAGVAPASDQDAVFVLACREGRIRPDDIAGDDARATLARRIVARLNGQGFLGRLQPSGA